MGKIRKRWLPATISQLGISTLSALKEAMDPGNVFASGNLVDETERKEMEKSKI